MARVINVVFAINSGYVRQLIISVHSLAKHNQESTFQVFVLSSGLERSEEETIYKATKQHKNINVIFRKVDKARFKNLRLSIEYITVETYYRYLIPEVLPSVNKVIYLDADILVKGSIGELWDKDLGDNYIGGVEDSYIQDEGYKKQINFDENDLYINAGVIVMNLDLIRRDNKVVELFDNTEKWHDKVAYQDQDIINMTFKSKIKRLDGKYNFTSRDSIKYVDRYNDARILHFTGPEKPWNRYGEDGRLYTHYLYDRYVDLLLSKHESKKASHLQERILDVYKEFKRICDLNGLSYVAAGGTKIGAVRHEGFIPWDDDIDIDMPYKDYKKFLRIAPRQIDPRYELRPVYGGISCVMMDKNTMFTEYFYLGDKEKYTGVFIDVHPVFGTPNNPEARAVFLDEMFDLSNDIIFNSIAGNYTDSETRSRKEYHKYIKLAEQYDVYQSEYVLTMLGQLKYKGVYAANLFLNSFDMTFEDTTIPVPAGFDEQLKAQYGDYSLRAAPISEEERSIHKSRAIIDLDKPYRQYAKELDKTMIPDMANYLTHHIAMGWLSAHKQNQTIMRLEAEINSISGRVPGIRESIKQLLKLIAKRLLK